MEQLDSFEFIRQNGLKAVLPKRAIIEISQKVGKSRQAVSKTLDGNEKFVSKPVAEKILHYSIQVLLEPTRIVDRYLSEKGIELEALAA